MSAYNRKSLEVCYKDTILNAIVMKSWTSNLSNKETQGLTALDWENLSIFCLTYTLKKRERWLCILIDNADCLCLRFPNSSHIKLAGFSATSTLVYWDYLFTTYSFSINMRVTFAVMNIVNSAKITFIFSSHLCFSCICSHFYSSLHEFIQTNIITSSYLA